jgi:hypothetical protein
MAIHRTTRPRSRVSHSPPPNSTDSDVVVLALVTARALEVQGDIREAAQWLRRAADQARKDGNEGRVVVLARAAVDLVSTLRPVARPVPSASLPRRPARTSLRRSTSREADPSMQPSPGNALEAMLALMAAAG